jgi:predicted amidohydrolase YtcJ
MTKTQIFFFVWTFIFFLASGANAQPESWTKEKSLSALTNPDIILHNANVITLDEQMPSAQAISIEGNRISAVGTDAEILALQTAGTQLIDLEGKTVVPGLIEGHDHLLQRGYFENGAEGLARATQRMAANGYTTVHQLFSSESFIATAQELAQNGELAVRMNFYLPYNTNCNTDVIPWNIFPYTEEKDTTVRVVGVKIFADGGTCGLLSANTTPFVGYPGIYGDLFRTENEMNTIVATVLDAGYPIAMHALGDSAVGVGLNAFENAFAGQGNRLRSRMEHVRVMREDLADQMADLGIAASIQYTWARARRAPTFEALYLPSVLEWLYPWRRMVDRGIPIVGGNDFPYAQRIQSMQTISYLATRRTERSDTLAAWMEGDQLTVEEGLRSMTVTNAWIVFEEDVKGTITPEKLADLTILSDDPLAIDPFDVRKIKIEMTIMDGLIRNNKLNKPSHAIHDAGSFSISIDDRGLWGPERAQAGLQVLGIEQLFQGSILVSYDTNTVATATYRQQDYATLPDGWVHFQEPGTIASEEATVMYEDVSTNHPNRLRIRQNSFMWEDDPLLLVKYAFENPHDHTVSDLYLGQFMSFNITGSGNEWTSFEDDLAGWEENDGLGFAYMYDNDQTAPYIGVAMFDPSGTNANNALSFTAGVRLNWGGDESRFSKTMRNGIIESEAALPGNYSILMSSGPFSIDAGQSISPFMVAFVAGENLDDLKNAVNQAYQRSTLVVSVEERSGQVPDEFRLFQNYPNPFNPSTTIRFSLPKAMHVKVEVFNALGQRVITLLDEPKVAGSHRIDFDAQNLGSGVYVLRIEARAFRAAKKMLYLK